MRLISKKKTNEKRKRWDVESKGGLPSIIILLEKCLIREKNITKMFYEEMAKIFHPYTLIFCMLLS